MEAIIDLVRRVSKHVYNERSDQYQFTSNSQTGGHFPELKKKPGSAAEPG